MRDFLANQSCRPGQAMWSSWESGLCESRRRDGTGLSAPGQVTGVNKPVSSAREVPMYTGFSAESPKACRSFLIAVLML